MCMHGILCSVRYGVQMMTSAAESEPRGYVLKVSDFGLSQQFSTDQTHQTSDYYGTVTHAAPEYMITGKLSKAADVYAFGIVLWEICAGKRPWGGFTHGDIIHRCALPSFLVVFHFVLDSLGHS